MLYYKYRQTRRRGKGGDTMLRIAICDDLPDQIRRIRGAAEQYFAGSAERVAYTAYENGFTFLDEADRFDIALVDICMPGLLGTDVVREMKKRRCRAEVVFLTTSDEFAVQAFSLHAAYYLVKPFTQDEFNSAMERAVQQLTACRGKKIAFRLVGRGVQIEEISAVLYIESSGHILQIHLRDGTCLEPRLPLQTLQEQLEALAPGQFRSPGKGFLVNLEHIHRIKTDYLEMNGRRIPLARRRCRQFQEDYFRFYFQQDL